ncbi:hypothetical protein Acr_05g0012450 [Actinidia rufa]|uniref:Uncharacterized protein n=1 Tax=Actinidia rufa TaxID=165716 RepID=A0A7J0EN73_9ERIC|nr:hypothetical protein Acr_05g0012450 [Actinidia rufa]
MVRTKHASNDPRGNDPNPAKAEMVFKPWMFKTMEIQRTWLPEFKDRLIIMGQRFEKSFHLKYYQKMLALMHVYIAYNIISKAGHYNQVTTMDAFIIYKAAMDKPLNLNYIVLKEMDDVRNHSNRALSIVALLTKGYKIDSTEDEGKEDEADKGTSRLCDEIEENLDIPSSIQWRDEETMHVEVPLQRESPMHEEAPVQGEILMYGGHPSQEGTSSQGGPPA